MSTIKEYANRFLDSEEAFCRLDSIAYLARELGLDERDIRGQTVVVVEIAVAYDSNEQIEALKVIESRYNEAINEPRSRILRFAQNKDIGNPVDRLLERTKNSLKENRTRLTIKGLDNVAEDVFLGFKLSEISRQPPHHRRGADKTGS